MAEAVWTVVIRPRYKVAADFLDYIDARKGYKSGGYKGVTKDLWKTLPEFCREVELSEDRALHGWTEDSSCASTFFA